MHRRESQPKSRKKAATPDIAGKAAAAASSKTPAWMENQAEDPERLPATAADFKVVMQAIIDSFRGRMNEVKQRVSQPEDTVCDQGADLHTLKTKLKALETRTEDAENRNRRNNLRVLGLPEGAEGTDPTAFSERLLQQLLPSARFSPFFTVERAHRIPSTRGPQGAPPHTFIFKLLHFRDRDTVMKEARSQCEF